jgi:2-aminoethylphosphonate transport system permease protein
VVTLAVIVLVFVLPFVVIVVASFAGQWNGVLPSDMGVQNYVHPTADVTGALVVSLVTAFSATVAANVFGGWAALVARRFGRGVRRSLDVVYFMPIAVPSVVIGLSLLVAYSEPPVVLDGQAVLVIIAHTVIITPFAYSAISAGLAQLDPAYEQVAGNLGASPARVLTRVTLPLVLPSVMAGAALCFALSIGELGATSMVYPPTWQTMPVNIYSLAERGYYLGAAELSVVLLATALVVLVLSLRVRTRAVVR